MWSRLKPFLLVLYPIAAARLALDFWDRESLLTKNVSIYWAVAILIVWLGLTRRWGFIGFRAMMGTVALAAALTFGICNSIAYTVGQFMGWQTGRYDPENSAPLAEGTLGKILAGLTHGAISTLAATVYMGLFACAFVLVIKKPEDR